MSDVHGKKAQRLKEAHYLKTFRYTQNQRRRESKTKIYAKRNDNLKKETKINDKTVKEIEAELSDFKFNRKTLRLEWFIIYLEKKYQVYDLLAGFYRQECFRKTKWHIHINTQRSESLMLNRFQDEYNQVLIYYALERRCR